MIRVTFSKYLHPKTNGRGFVDVTGSTVQEALNNLIQILPDLRSVLFADRSQTEVRRFVHVVLDGKEIRTRDELKSVTNDGAEIIIYPDVA